jgi:LacI family transcriptional regulator
MSNIKDVARRAKVSIATVSRVLNETGFVSEELEQRVRNAVTELDYKPNAVARHLRRSQSFILGMLIPDSSNPFFAEIAKGVEDHCFARGYTLVLCNTDEKPEKAAIYFSTLFEHRVAGFIVISPEGLDQQIQQLLDQGYPIVLGDRPLPSIQSADSVVSDNYGGARDAMQHLVELGHRRIGLIVGASALDTIDSRLRGAEDVLQAAGIEIDPDLVVRRANYLPQDGYRAAEMLLNRPDPPSAIFAFNDLMAFGVLNYAQQHGVSIPEQLSVVGFDDIAMAAYSVPPLTTIAQPKYDLGKVVAELLLRRIGGDEQTPVHLVLPTKLVVRQSTA